MEDSDCVTRNVWMSISLSLLSAKCILSVSMEWACCARSLVDHLGEETYAKGEDVALCDDDAFSIALDSFHIHHG